MKNKIIGFILLLMLTTVLSACGNAKFKADYDLALPDFEHINQRGEAVSLKSLKGKPWIGMYIFTNCTSICPPMSFNMAQVQEKLKKKKVWKIIRLLRFQWILMLISQRYLRII